MTDKENDESKPKDGKKSSKQRSEEVASNIVNAINNCPANNSQRRIGLLNLQQINRNSRQIKLETQQEILELLENDEPDENADEMRKRHDRRGYARWYAVILRRNFDLPPRLSGNTYVQNLLAHAKALHAGEHSPGPRPNRKRSNHKSSSAEEPQPKIQATNTNNVQEEAAGLGMEGEEEEERMDMEAATRESRAQIPLYQPRQPSLPTQTQPASMPTRMPEIFVDTQASFSRFFMLEPSTTDSCYRQIPLEISTLPLISPQGRPILQGPVLLIGPLTMLLLIPVTQASPFIQVMLNSRPSRNSTNQLHPTAFLRLLDRMLSQLACNPRHC